MSISHSTRGKGSPRAPFRTALVVLSLSLPVVALPLQGERFAETLQLQLPVDKTKPARQFEMEHRPLPRREYVLTTTPAPNAKAFLLRANGSNEPLSVGNHNGEYSVSFESKWKDDALHGPNSVYVFDSVVANGSLISRTAKWIVIHHNCAWGHPHKYVENRLVVRPLEQIPLEIVPEPLWDGNFHVDTETGKTLSFKVMSYGKPAAGAELTVLTDQGWQKTLLTDAEGKASFQLIRDYYSSTWNEFHRDHLGALQFSARYTIPKSGTYEGKAYRQQILTTTLSWRYKPSRADYTSLASGLGIILITMMVSFAMVWWYRDRRRKPVRRLRFDE